MKIQIKGGVALELSQSDFLESGGQGSVYAKSGTAYKIYNDPSKMIPEAKIYELSVLKHPNIIKPEDIILDSKRKAIGYTMKYVKDTWQLCQLFPKPFRTRNNLTPDDVVKIVQKMQEGVDYVHKNGILIVDLNENNFLVSKKFDEVYFIDVDSYQTHSFPANAILTSIQDRHAKTFTTLSDWFSFAIVTFYLFRGIHPYRGTHPNYSSLDERMINNISIFNKDVRYPQASVLPESVIPQAYKDWYYAVLEDGKRIPPPNSLVNVIVVTTTQVKNLIGNLFDFIEQSLFTQNQIKGEPLALYGNICLTNESVINSKNNKVFSSKPGSVIGFDRMSNTPYFVKIEDWETLRVINLDDGTTSDLNIEAEALFESGESAYVKSGSNILELTFIKNKILFKQCISVLPKATQVFHGCIIQNMLGAYFVSVFEHSSHYQINLKELKGYKIVDAKYENKVLMVVGSQNGIYTRFIFKLDLTGAKHSVRILKDVSYAGLNFVALPQGVCASVNEDGSLELFHNSLNSNDVKHLDDPATHGLTLMKYNSMVVVYKNGKFHQLKMK